jgi:chromosome partitioning protein
MKDMKKPTIISVGTAKGGVSKTTSVVVLAEFLAGKGHKVLVIDGDYQANCSVALIGNQQWEKINADKRTIIDLIEDAINEGTPGYKKQFDVNTHIIKGVSNLSQDVVGDRIDLLASTPDLNVAKKNLYKAGKNAFFDGAVNRMNFLEWGLRSILHDYDFILIDTHPDIDDMLNAALYLSDYILMPVIPDAVSSYGIKTMNTYIKKFNRECNQLKLLGAMISIKREINVHNTYTKIIEGLCKNENIYLFKTVIPQRAKVTESMDFSLKPNTLKNKYGYDGMFERYTSLVEEVIQRCQELEKQ